MKKRKTKNKLAVGIAVCSVAINSASKEVQIFPAGHFKGRDGRPKGIDSWFIDAGIASKIIEQAALRTTPYLIDYEHQTLHAEENGQPAPRSAKFSTFEWREGDGLYAVDVAWTTRAKGFIENEEYEFISPVFPFNKKTGEVLGFFHAALTNDPAIDGMESVAELAAAKFQLNENNTEENTMNEFIIALLGLPKDASEEDVQQAVAALKSKLVDTRKLLGVDEDGDVTAAVAALKTKTEARPDPAKFVPVGVVQELQTQVAALSTQINQSEVDDLVEVALSEGKLMLAQEDWARGLGKTDVAALKGYLDSATAIPALANKQTKGKKDDDVDAPLSESEVAICKQMGIDHEEYKKEKAAA